MSPAGSEERLSDILPIGVFSETESESDSGGVTSSNRGTGGVARIPVHDAPQLLPLQGTRNSGNLCGPYGNLTCDVFLLCIRN